MKKIKLNLTKDFCNSCKDLCNVFLKLKWTIKSIGGRGKKISLCYQLLSIKGNLGLSKHLQWLWNKHLLFKVPRCSLMGQAQWIHWSTFFKCERIISIKDNQMTKLQSFVWKPTGYIKHTLIPWHSGDLNPIIKRFQYSLTEKKRA